MFQEPQLSLLLNVSIGLSPFMCLVAVFLCFFVIVSTISYEMAEEITASDAVTKFMLKTTRLCPKPNFYALKALFSCAAAITTGVDDPVIEVEPASTGSNSEFYIEPMLSCVGDRDVMYFDISQLAVPAGYGIPTELPPEFHTFVKVYKIVNSGFAGYIYLIFSHFLLEDDDGVFKTVECDSNIYLPKHYVEIDDDPNSTAHRTCHGPATTYEADALPQPGLLANTWAVDFVRCIRCLVFPPQAAKWPKRLRNYGWPDSTTVDYVVRNGCDVVPVAHPLCRQHEWLGTYQWRLSFSRAETVLLNSWTPIQQIAYHMLRVFMKTGGFAERANSGDNKLSNYHIKTLMLWSAELKSSTWWSGGPNLVRVCVELLHILSTQMTDVRCEHYFVDSCNLFPAKRNSDEFLEVAALLASLTEATVAQWFVDNYIKRCCRELDTCKSVAPMFNSISNCAELDAAVSALISHKLHYLPLQIFATFQSDQFLIIRFISRGLFTVRSIVNFISQLKSVDYRLFVYATASVFLHAAFEIQKSGVDGDFDNYVEVLTALIQCFSQSCPPTMTNSRRRFLSKNLFRKTVEILKAVVNTSLGTMELIQVELAKEYLHKTLRCKDSDIDSIFCVANVYLAVLYYATGHYQTAIDRCTLVTGSEDHSQCDSHVVQGELLLKINDEVDSILGLAVFYQYIKRAALNQQQTKHVSVFTTDLFAHYLRIKCHFALTFSKNISVHILSNFHCFTKRYLASGSVVGLVISDVLLLKTFLKELRQFENVGSHFVENCFQEKSESNPQLAKDTSKLVGSLQKCAVELLTSFRYSERQDFGAHLMPITSDFEALYAFHRGQYRQCIRICKDIVNRLFGPRTSQVKLTMFPEFMQLMDDDIVSLFGLVLLLKPTVRDNDDRVFFRTVCISQLSLALYLLAQSQIKLNYFPLALSDTVLCTSLTRVVTEQRHPDNLWELLVLKLTERRITMYKQMCLSQRRSVDEYDSQSFEEFAADVKAVAVARNISA